MNYSFMYKQNIATSIISTGTLRDIIIENIRGLNFVYVSENQTSNLPKLLQLLHESIREIDSHIWMFMRIVARISSTILIEFVSTNIQNSKSCWKKKKKKERKVDYDL